MTKLTKIVTGAAVAAAIAAPVAAEVWDMPMAYSASNFHSANGAEFAACVTTGTGGDIEIVTHPGGSLFPGAQIKRAIQTGQVPIGERLLSGHQNENALFGYDSIPFLATSFDDADTLWKAAKGPMTELLASQNLTLLYAVPWPPQGLYFKDEVTSVAEMAGIKFRSYNNATSRLAELTGMLPVTIEAAEISQRTSALSVTDEFIRREIRQNFEEFDLATCPHTATATFAWRHLDRSARTDKDWIMVATAHPAKFEQIVEPIISGEVALPAELAEILSRPSRFVKIDPDAKALAKALSEKFSN